MQFRSERAFTDAVIDLAKMSGWMVMHMRGDTHRLIQGMAGYPDLTLVKNGEVEWWELKMEKGLLTEAQRKWGLALYPRWRLLRPLHWTLIVEILTAK